MSSPPSEETILYYAKVCPWAQRATLANIESGANFKLYEIDLANKPTWYASHVNPASKVPTLKIGNEYIPESGVLLEFFADYKPDTILPMNDPIKRAEVRYFTERFMSIVINPYHAILLQGKQDSVEALFKGIREMIGFLKKYSDGPYFLGEKISIGDLAILPFLARLFATGQEGLLTGGVYETLTTDSTYKPFVEYFEALAARESYKATFDEELAVNATKAHLAAMKAQ